MAKSKDLFNLIKSLNKAEKRHFKLSSDASKKNLQYIKLFDCMNELKEYDEGRLQQLTHKFVSGNQLHVLKHQLLVALLKNLRTFHHCASIEAVITNTLLDVEILFRKELYRLCTDKLQKVEEMARTNEKQLALLDVLAWKRKLLLSQHSSYEVLNELNHIAKEEQHCLSKIDNTSRYWQLSLEIFQHNSSNSEKFKSNPLVLYDNQAQTVQAKTLRYHVLFADAFMQGDLSKADLAIRDVIDLLEQYPMMIKDDPGAYFTAINNRVSLKLNSKQLQEIPPLLEKIRTTAKRYQIKRDNAVLSKHLLRTYNVELEMYRDSQQYKPGIALIDSIVPLLSTQNYVVQRDIKVLFFYQFAYLYYLDRNYTQSLHWLNEISKGKFGSIRQDIQSYGRLLALIIHYELGNVTVLKYAVDSCRRFLKTKQILRRFENKLLIFFSRLSMTAPGTHKGLFHKIHAELFHTDNQEITASVLDYLDFRTWLESKLG